MPAKAGRGIRCARNSARHFVSWQFSAYRGASSSSSAESSAWRQRHRTAADAGAVEEGVSDGGRYGHDGSFASAGGGDVFAIKEDRFDLREIVKTRHTIGCEMGILDFAVFELNGFEECAAEALNV